MPGPHAVTLILWSWESPWCVIALRLCMHVHLKTIQDIISFSIVAVLHQQAVLWPRGHGKRLSTISSCVSCKAQMPPPPPQALVVVRSQGQTMPTVDIVCLCAVCHPSCRLMEPACRHCWGEHCTCVSLHNNKFDISRLCIDPAAWARAEPKPYTIVPSSVEIACSSWNQIFLHLNRTISDPEFFTIHSNMSLVCTCKLSKVWCLRNAVQNGHKYWESPISVKNGLVGPKLHQILLTIFHCIPDTAHLK